MARRFDSGFAVLSLLTLASLAALAACKDGPPPVVAPQGTDPATDAAVPSASPSASTSGTPTAPSTALTADDSGKPVTLAVGAPLVVKLRASAGSGFTWEIAKNDPKILAPQGEPKNEPVDPNQVGGHAVKVFTFAAQAPGTAHLEIVLHRPWEKDTPPTRTFAIDVTVK